MVVFSGSSRETDRNRALALGASDYVQKPTDLQAFRQALWGIIDNWALGKRP
jgi:CheY-like chemotaxis protein